MEKEKLSKKESGKNLDLRKIKHLLKKNLEVTERIERQNQKIFKKFKWMSVLNYIRLALIIIPVILALIYLPPLFQRIIDEYRSILPQNSNVVPEIVPEILNYFKK